MERYTGLYTTYKRAYREVYWHVHPVIPLREACTPCYTPQGGYIPPWVHLREAIPPWVHLREANTPVIYPREANTPCYIPQGGYIPPGLYLREAIHHPGYTFGREAHCCAESPVFFGREAHCCAESLLLFLSRFTVGQ